MPEREHQRFTAEGTAYMHNLSRDDLYHHKWMAVLYQDPPKRDEVRRTTSISLRAPVLIVSHYLEDERAVAEKVARILNKHWDDDDA